MRVPSWESRLREAIFKRWDTPFEWGEFDCCLAPCELAHAITGRDPLGHVRGGYYSPASAFRVVKEALPDYDGDRADIMSAFFGKVLGKFQEQKINFAQRGDLVQIRGVPYLDHPEPFNTSLAVVDFSARNVITTGQKGWVTVPLTFAYRSWRVN